MKKKEPALKVGTYTAIVSALLTVAASFGLNLTAQQTTAILGAVAVLAPIVAAVITRSKVTPFVPEHRAE
jgi:hypothetical protein